MTYSRTFIQLAQRLGGSDKTSYCQVTQPGNQVMDLVPTSDFDQYPVGALDEESRSLMTLLRALNTLNVGMAPMGMQILDPIATAKHTALTKVLCQLNDKIIDFFQLHQGDKKIHSSDISKFHDECKQILDVKDPAISAARNKAAHNSFSSDGKRAAANIAVIVGAGLLLPVIGTAIALLCGNA